MKTDTFPINYFKSIWTPLQAFANRHQLGWPGIIVVLLFLNALLVIPMTMNFAQNDTFPLEQIYPQTMQMIEEHPVEPFQQADYGEGQMNIAEPFYSDFSHGVVAGGLPEEEAEQLMNTEDTVIYFDQTHFYIQESDFPPAAVPYSEDFSLAEAENGREVVDRLSRQWFIQNQVFFVLFFSFLIGSFLLVMLLVLVFGAAVFFYLTKESTITSIETYKESVNLLVNALGVPTLIAMIAGLIQFNIVMMLMIQTVGLIIYLMVIFVKTRFNDNNLNKVMQE